VKRLRILILAFFVVVFLVFLVNRIHEYVTSDYTAPVIEAEQDSLNVSVNATEQDLLQGMTASDNLDGDVTDTLVVVSKSKFISPGTLRVNYAAFDQNNNVGSYSRMVTYTDYIPPRFSMSQPLRFANGNSKYDYLRYITAQDSLDGNITSQIKITFGNTETVSDTVSSQRVNLQVTNSAGDTSVLALTATFEDYATYSMSSPALDQYIVYTQKGVKPDYRAMIRGIWTAGAVRELSKTDYDLENDFRINDYSVNYKLPGAYIVSFQLVQHARFTGAETELGTTNLILIVED
jgi:hypothetical protein